MARKSTLDVIREEQERRGFGAALESFVILRKNGDEVTLRFLDELEGKNEDDKRVAKIFKVHAFGGKWDKNKKTRNLPFQTILCSGVNCTFCDDGNVPQTHVVIRAWVYDDNTVKLFSVNARADIMVDLADDFDRYGNITGADYIYNRKDRDRVYYRLIRQPESPFKKKKSAKREWITNKTVRELVEMRHSGSVSNGIGRKKREEDEDEDSVI